MTEASQTRSTAPFEIMIIGGGLGGLCLANGLTSAGIEVTVCERDAGAGFRDQGYRISLKPTGAQALHDCLPPHLFDLCVATSIGHGIRMMVFADTELRPKFSKPVPQQEPGLSGFGVNRLTLREILLAGLDDRVQFGKTFDKFEQLEGGRVRAWFADGTSTDADLLVGADGTHSAVRGQLIPDAVIDELHYAIYGKTPITPNVLDQAPDVLIDTFNRVIGEGDAAFSVATCRTLEPATSAAARIAPGVHLTDTPPYLQWVTPMLDLRNRTADPATLHRVATEMVTGWHPGIRTILDNADITATFPVAITSARPVKPWHTANITLLGDAIHTMSPGRGDGANIALRDAQVLTRALTQAAQGNQTLTEAKRAYETDMLQYGFAAVSQSLHQPFGKKT
ncbi:FAD-dependent monooxygenase [Amycolatopsis mediterranei]|uniref:FAD-dependent oxidoreductase n=1 Tax=Amycolatopsis mediterranei TaxID=33910 RepID=UPI00343F0276